MTKILKSKFKVSRRLGCSIWGSDKDTVLKRNYKPGQHSASTRSYSDYGSHLIDLTLLFIEWVLLILYLRQDK